MRFYKWFAVSLVFVVQIISGCGGGGGGSAVGSPPVISDTTAPIVNSFTMPVTSVSMTVTISSFSATDAIGVTGYLITESSTVPAASEIGWAASAPTSFTFSSIGTKTAYAWAKDAAGNVSNGLPATTTITLVDTIAPTVSSFELSSPSVSLTVPISSLTAADNVGVTGYLVNETSTAPVVSASGWSASAPSSFTFTSAGTKTAYAWAKDAAGNVSNSRSASTAITLPTTKTSTLKFYSQSTNQSELLGGFLLSVILPVGSLLPVDSSGVPLFSAVFLSGQFTGASPQINTYDSVSRKLTVNFASSNDYRLGEFMTVIMTVPFSYVPNPSDITTSFGAWSPSGVGPLDTVTATFTFN